MSTTNGVIRAMTCYTIDCSDCGPDCWSDYSVHFTSEEDLRRGLVKDYGWTYDRHGRWLCEGCTSRADCQRDGHAWSEWSESSLDAEVMYRWCDRCSKCEDALAAMFPGGGGA